MRTFTISALVLVCLVCLLGIANAVRPSGPGQTNSAGSLSVAIATDQSRVPVSEIPQAMQSITPSDTADASPGCNGAVYVGTPDAGTMTVYGCGSDASAQFSGLGSGQTVKGCFRRIEATGTAARGLVCESY